jgi:mannose-6-phosphate isomerase-like protein (cupin superfamily)
VSLPADPGSTFLPADAIPTLRIGATTARFVATGTLTDGRFGLFRWDMTASSGGAAPHFHKTISESFYVVSGSVELFDGSSFVPGRPGDFLYVPERGVHGFRNVSGEDASILILFAPGGPREDYFRELAARLAAKVDAGPEERAAFLARHDQYEV